MSNVQSPRWVAAILATCVIVGFSVRASSPSAALDSSFAIGSGAGLPSDGSSWPQVTAVAVQNDGKVIAGGQAYFTNFNGTPINYICRINDDGSLDTAFGANIGSGPAGQSITISKFVVQPDGKILVGGTFSTFNGLARSGIVRLNTDGSVDTSFLNTTSGAGGVFAPNVSAIALQADGKIVVGGFFYSFGGQAVPSLARLNTNGTVDSSFVLPVTQGIGINGVGVQPDGKVFAGGTFSSWNGFTTPGIVRLNPDGSLDASFAPTHTIPFPSITSLYAPGDGSVYIGGFVEGTQATTTRYFAHLNSNGSIDTGYPTIDGPVADIQPWPGGGILAGGRYRTAGGQPRGELCYIDGSGNVDATFAPQPYADLSSDLVHIYSVAVAPSGKVVFGGWFTNYPNNTQLNGQDYSGIGRFVGGYVGGAGSIQFLTASNQVSESAGGLKISVLRFGGVSGAVTVNYSTAAGTATAGSDYTTTSNQLSWADGETGVKTFTVPILSDNSPEPSETFTVSLSSPTGGAVLGTPSTMTVTITDDDSAPSVTSAPHDTTVNLSYPVTFTVGVLSGLPVRFQWFSNNVAIAGVTNSFLRLPNAQLSFAASYSVVVSNSVGSTTSSPALLTVKIPSGLDDSTFVPPPQGFNNDVYAVAFQSNGIVAAGAFTQFGGVAIPNYIARLNLDGSRDTTFPAAPSGANGLVQCLSQYPDGRWLIAGAFTQYSGTNCSRVARLNPNGSLDLTFSNSAVSASTVAAVLPQPDGTAYIGDNAFVRKYQTNGANDTNYVSANLIGQVYALAQQSDGKILAAPYKSSSPATAEIVRLNSTGYRDLSFPAISFNGQVNRLLILKDGRFLAAGSFTGVSAPNGSNAAPYIAAFTPDGNRDLSFNIGTGPDNNILDVSQRNDGHILVAGSFATWNGVTASRYIGLLPTGEVDPTFVTGAGANNYVRAINLDPATGRIAIGGGFTQVNGQPANRIALLTYGPGTAQFTTNFQQIGEASGPVTVTVERVAGMRGPLSVNYTTVSGTADSTDFTPTSGTISWADGDASNKTFSVTLNNDGVQENDETFSVQLSSIIGDGTYGLYTNQTIQILDANSAPRITVQPASQSSPQDVSVAFTVTGLSALPISYQWQSNGVNILNATNPTLTLVNVQSNYAANYSVRLSNSVSFIDSSNAVLTVIPSSTRVDSSFVVSPALNGTVRAILPIGDGRVMAGGDFTSPRTGIVLLGQNGNVDATFTNTATGGSVQVWDIQRDRKGRFLIGGQFAQFAGITSSNLVRLNPDYTVDRDFITAMNGMPNGLVRDVAVAPDGKIWIGGPFTSVGLPYGVRYCARLNDDGSVDLSFTPRANNSVNRVIPLADGTAFLGGDFTSYQSTSGALVHAGADGSRDPNYSFGISTTVLDLLMRPDGSMFVGGGFTTPSSRIARYDATGKLDTRYLGGATGNGNVNSIALQSNGKLVGVGAFTSFGTQSNRFVRINADGAIDNSIFIGTGFQTSGAYKVAVEANGQIYVGGAFTTFKGTSAPYLVRLNGEAPTVAIGQQPFDRVVAPGSTTTFTISAFGAGTLSYQWMKDGVALADAGSVSGSTTTNLTISSVSAANEGAYSIVVSNNLGASAVSLPAMLLVRSAPVFTQMPVGGLFPAGGQVLLKGQVDSPSAVAFQWLKNGSPVGPSSAVYSLRPAAVSDSGSYQLVASNSFGATTSSVAVVTVQISPAGTAPGFFADAGTGSSSDNISALQPLIDGRLVVGGTFNQLRTNGANFVFRSYLAAFATNGNLDAFSPAPDNIVYDVVRQADGKIVVAGLFQNIAGNARQYIARFNTNLTFDTNFSTTLGTGPDSAVNDIAIQPDGKILLAGSFTAISGQANTRGIARLNSDGSVDTTFASAISSLGSGTLVDVLPDGRIYFVGSGQYGGASASVYRINTNGTVDATFTNSLGSSVTALSAMPDGSVLVGGTFLTLNGQTRPILARLISNGEVDYSFFGAATNTTALNQSSIRAICVQDNGKVIVGGTFLTFGPFRNGLARFNADGSPDSSFIFQQGYGDSSFANVISRIVTFGDGRIAIGGTFSTWEGVTENNLAILNGDPAGTNTYYNWAAGAGLTAANNDPAADPDTDTVPNVFEYYSGTTPLSGASALHPAMVFIQVGNEIYPALTFIHNKNTTGVTVIPRVSDNVLFSTSLGSTFVSATDLGDGTEQIIIRSNSSTTTIPTQFLEMLLRLNP